MSAQSDLDQLILVVDKALEENRIWPDKTLRRGSLARSIALKVVAEGFSKTPKPQARRTRKVRKDD